MILRNSLYSKPPYAGKERITVFKYCAYCVVVLSLSSCCTPGLKPEDANLFQAACGITSGDFEKQTTDLQKQADASQEAKSEEKKEAERLEAELHTHQKEHARLKKRLSDLERENEELNSRVSALKEDTAFTKRRKKEQQNKLESIQQKIRDVKLKSTSDQLNTIEYEAELTQLKREVATLRAIILSQ